MTEATMSNGLGLNPTQISAIAPAVDGRIRVQNLAVPSGPRHTYSKTSPQNRREIADTDNRAAAGGRDPQKGDHVVVGRVRIEPCEPGRLHIGFPQRRFFTIEAVQVANQRTKPAMGLVFE